MYILKTLNYYSANIAYLYKKANSVDYSSILFQRLPYERHSRLVRLRHGRLAVASDFLRSETGDPHVEVALCNKL
jgi:hypothetical protein